MKKIKNIICLFIGIFILLILSGCHNNVKSTNNQKLEITTTFYPMYYFSKEIVKDKAQVNMLIPDNMEPHDYEPSAKDIASIEKSALFIYNSNDLETWVPTLKQTLSDSSVKVLEASKGISLLKDHEHGNDPHVWLDPILAIKEVKNIYNTIIKLDEKHKSFYKKNTQSLIKRLEALNQKYLSVTKNAKHKTFVTQHAAFSYLAHQYGLTQEAISGIDPEQEPTPKQLSKIENTVKKNNIHYIYVEELSSHKIANTIKEATGATLLPLNTLESLPKEKQKDGANYFSVMEQNLEMLKKSLH